MKHATVAHALTQRKCSWSSNAPGGHALNLTLIAQWRPVHFVFIFQCFIHAHMQSTTDASTFFQIQCQLLCNSAQFNPSLDQPSTTFQLLPYPLLNFHPYSHQVFSSFIISPYVSAELKKNAPKSRNETTRINTAYSIYRSDVIISIDAVLLVYCSD